MKLFLIGGFLGSGKTTAILKASHLLESEGVPMAVVTNDQGDQQVDAAFFRSQGVQAEEVSNGCFCCNFDRLDHHIGRMLEDFNAEVVFAESVGSCTDLIATVAKPMARLRPDLRMIISVFTDADLLASLIEGSARFTSDDLRYIYKKQLEEADILVVNKIDLIPPSRLELVRQTITEEYPGKVLLFQNSLKDEDVRAWLDTLNEWPIGGHRNSLELDYDRYGDGEAQLAWLDKSLVISSPYGEAVRVADRIIHGIYSSLMSRNLAIGHLKFFVEGENWNKKISFTMTDSGSEQLSGSQKETNLKMLINARVQTDPEQLTQIVHDVLNNVVAMYACKIEVGRWTAFSPAYPRPTYRI